MMCQLRGLHSRTSRNSFPYAPRILTFLLCPTHQALPAQHRCLIFTIFSFLEFASEKISLEFKVLQTGTDAGDPTFHLSLSPFSIHLFICSALIARPVEDSEFNSPRHSRAHKRGTIVMANQPKTFAANVDDAWLSLPSIMLTHFLFHF